MANPHAVVLSERAVRTYEDSLEFYAEVADHFDGRPATPKRWVRTFRETGTVAPRARGGGWCSPVNLPALHALVYTWPGTTTEELTRAYNCRVRRWARLHPSSILRVEFPGFSGDRLTCRYEPPRIARG